MKKLVSRFLLKLVNADRWSTNTNAIDLHDYVRQNRRIVQLFSILEKDGEGQARIGTILRREKSGAIQEDVPTNLIEAE